MYLSTTAGIGMRNAKLWVILIGCVCGCATGRAPKLQETVIHHPTRLDQPSQREPSDGVVVEPLDCRLQQSPSGSTAASSVVVQAAAGILSEASGDPGRLTLEEVESIALQHNPALAAARASIRKAIGLQNQVGRPPNPRFGYSGQQLADRGTDQHIVFMEQDWIRGEKLQLNREVLGHARAAQEAEASVQTLRVLTDVRLHFYQALAAQDRMQAIADFREVAQRGLELAQQRQVAGEGSMVETLQAETLLSEIRLAAEQARIAYRAARQGLNAIAASELSANAILDGQLAPANEPIDWDATRSELLLNSPLLRVAEAKVAQQQTLLRRHQVEPIPNITAQLGSGYDREQDHGLINVQLSAPLPVWNKNQGNIIAAHADYVRATQEVIRIRQGIIAELADVGQTYDSAIAAVRTYTEKIFPQVNRSLTLSETAYAAGELDFLQVLIVRRSYYDAKLAWIDAQLRATQARARIDGLLLSGGLSSSVDHTDGDGLRGFTLSGQ